ncbi:hypothetical protein WJX84_002728 [Apatococcus fuscideae]|uniref:Tubulin beta chain n=1 Tax=Apatococcus fuscideae TaxID=2026836 RepID=A0AAW1SQ52_9CHLO
MADDSLSSFFEVGDGKSSVTSGLGLHGGQHMPLKARAIVVDMEEGVISEMLKGKLGGLFEQQQMLSDGFFLLHSLGGGTGSGLGTYLLSMLQDEFPGILRFACSVFPSDDDDVVTSPYNALLALQQLLEHADCVLPLENQALQDIATRLEAGKGGSAGRPFDGMNSLAAQLLLHLTAPMRFEGPLNVDLNEITTNLVPFPRRHFLLSGMAPFQPPSARPSHPGIMPSFDQMFGAALSRDNQLVRVQPKQGMYLACALLARGNVSVGDLNRGISRLLPTLQVAPWNPEPFKLGICATPPAGLPMSLLSLANNSCVGATFERMHERFAKLYRRRVFLHHYVQYMPAEDIQAASHAVTELIHDYSTLPRCYLASDLPQPKPLGLSFL